MVAVLVSIMNATIRAPAETDAANDYPAKTAPLKSPARKCDMADNTTWLDPWLKLREKTALRNELLTVADRYSKMQRLAYDQYQELKSRPKTAKDTLDGLETIIKFCGDKGAPLWGRIEKLETELREETERLNSDA